MFSNSSLKRTPNERPLSGSLESPLISPSSVCVWLNHVTCASAKTHWVQCFPFLRFKIFHHERTDKGFLLLYLVCYCWHNPFRYETRILKKKKKSKSEMLLWECTSLRPKALDALQGQCWLTTRPGSSSFPDRVGLCHRSHMLGAIPFLTCFWSLLMLETRPLCTGVKSDLGDRVLSEVEKNSFISLPGRGGHTGLLCVPSRDDLGRSFIAIAQGRGC